MTAAGIDVSSVGSSAPITRTGPAILLARDDPIGKDRSMFALSGILSKALSSFPVNSTLCGRHQSVGVKCTVIFKPDRTIFWVPDAELVGAFI